MRRPAILLSAILAALPGAALATGDMRGPCLREGEGVVCRSNAIVAAGNSIAVKLHVVTPHGRPAHARVTARRGACGQEQPVAGLGETVFAAGAPLGPPVRAERAGTYCAEARLACTYGCDAMFDLRWESFLTIEVR